MTGSDESTRGGPGRRCRWWARWLVSRWPLLRVLLQLTLAGAMLTQHEAVALTINVVSTLLEMVQDWYTGQAGRHRRREPGEHCSGCCC